MSVMNWILLHLAMISPFVSSSTISLDIDWVRKSFQSPPVAAKCGSDGKGPCVGLVGIHSHPNFFERRALIRQTWMNYRTPGLDFVFALALPGNELQLSPDLLRWEFETYQDIVFLNTTESDIHLNGTKSHAFFQWAATLGKGRYMFVAKGDDDDVINPYRLRLVMSQLPQTGRVFYGRHMPFFFTPGFENSRFPFPVKLLGMLYMMSYDLVEMVGGDSYQGQFQEVVQAIEAADHTVMAKRIRKRLGEDKALSAFVERFVPSSEWIRALPCELHNHPAYQQGHPINHSSTYNFSNQTIVAHKLKTMAEFGAAYAALLPTIKAMQEDCKEWHETSASFKTQPYLALPAEACRRWHQNTKCLAPPAAYLSKHAAAQHQRQKRKVVRVAHG